MAAVYFGLHAQDAREVRDAERLLLRGQLEAAADSAATVDRAPADARALVVRAHALGALGDFERADAAWQAAIRRDPNDWILEFEYARMLIRAGRFEAADRHIERARALNPQMRVTPFLAGAP